MKISENHKKLVSILIFVAVVIILVLYFTYKQNQSAVLTERIDGTISNINYQLHVPKGYIATTTCEYNLSDNKCTNEVVRIFRKYKTKSNLFYEYEDEILSLYTLPYTKNNKQALIDSETKTYTYKKDGPSFERSNYKFIGDIELYNNQYKNSRIEQFLAKVDVVREGGVSFEKYYVYNISHKVPQDKILVLRLNLEIPLADNDYTEYENKKILFFNITKRLVTK